MFLALHLGAGFHDPSNEDIYLELSNHALRHGMNLLSNKNLDAISTVEAICTILEDSPNTNAGLGSVFTFNGLVECDASIMSGDGIFGACAAVPGVYNPISLSKVIWQQNKSFIKSLLVPSLIVSGEGALLMAKENNIRTFENYKIPLEGPLSTLENVKRYHNYKEKENFTTSNKPSFDQNDTIGVICIDQMGNFASGVSTGGRWLKPQGRIGDSAIYGAGCWSENNSASCTSGIGEQMIKTFFAKSIVQYNSDIGSMEDFLKYQKDVGFIMITDHKGKLEFAFGHTTSSMAIGYISSSNDIPISFVSRLSNDKPFKLLVKSL